MLVAHLGPHRIREILKVKSKRSIILATPSKTKSSKDDYHLCMDRTTWNSLW